jgi:bifunctional NMN adenylyltransferase/nudix hydrolase
MDEGSFARPTLEYRANRLADQKFSTHPYPQNINSLCADTVVECKGYILLGKRKGSVGKRTWALPGGHKDKGETLQATALRELDEETCIKVPPMVLRKSIVNSHVFDNPGRSETIDEKITQAFHLILDNEPKLPKIRANDDLEEVKWVRLCDIRDMSHTGQIFADHAEIIHHFTGALI